MMIRVGNGGLRRLRRKWTNIAVDDGVDDTEQTSRFRFVFVLQSLIGRVRVQHRKLRVLQRSAE